MITLPAIQPRLEKKQRNAKAFLHQALQECTGLPVPPLPLNHQGNLSPLPYPLAACSQQPLEYFNCRWSWAAFTQVGLTCRGTIELPKCPWLCACSGTRMHGFVVTLWVTASTVMMAVAQGTGSSSSQSLGSLFWGLYPGPTD